jgi:DNA-binding response OmpR family regulator
MTQDADVRILVVEDEAMVAMYLEAVLDDMGIQVVGPAPTIEDGLRLLDGGRIDAALVDVNLGNGGQGYAIAEVLAARDIPFAFVTGYGAGALQGRYTDQAILHKPFRAHDIEDVVRALLSRARRPFSEAAPPR